MANQPRKYSKFWIAVIVLNTTFLLVLAGGWWREHDKQRRATELLLQDSVAALVEDGCLDKPDSTRLWTIINDWEAGGTPSGPDLAFVLQKFADKPPKESSQGFRNSYLEQALLLGCRRFSQNQQEMVANRMIEVIDHLEKPSASMEFRDMPLRVLAKLGANKQLDTLAYLGKERGSVSGMYRAAVIAASEEVKK